MIKLKICMLGAFAVGKTSLVRQYVKGIFDEKYHTTLGVRIDKKTLVIDGQSQELILWDLAGEDEFMEVRSSYLRGSSAIILVTDGTRSDTLNVAIKLKNKVFSEVGKIPFVLLINKTDLIEHWTIDKLRLEQLEQDGWNILQTSAKEDKNVEAAFRNLTEQMLEKI